MSKDDDEFTRIHDIPTIRPPQPSVIAAEEYNAFASKADVKAVRNYVATSVMAVEARLAENTEVNKRTGRKKDRLLVIMGLLVPIIGAALDRGCETVNHVLTLMEARNGNASKP